MSSWRESAPNPIRTGLASTATVLHFVENGVAMCGRKARHGWQIPHFRLSRLTKCKRCEKAITTKAVA